MNAHSRFCVCSQCGRGPDTPFPPAGEMDDDPYPDPFGEPLTVSRPQKPLPDRWNKDGKRLPSDPRIEAFLDEIEQVCRKHRMTISHEDHHGSFDIEDFSGGPVGKFNAGTGERANAGEYNIAWLRLARDNR